MKVKLKSAVLAATAIAVVGAGGAAIAGATGGTSSATGDERGGHDDGNGTPIAGQPLDRAKTVALQHTGGGKVTGSEVNDEEGAYEVEVTLADGRQVDVHLDKAFKVIDSSADGGQDSGR